MAADLSIPAIRALIAEQLPVRYPKVEQIARRLDVPVRTLQRRLERAGSTYSGLVEETRFFLARRLLAQPDVNVAEVAKLLGYRDPSSFSRAFRRWTGDPPRAHCRHATSSKSMPGGLGELCTSPVRSAAVRTRSGPLSSLSRNGQKTVAG